MKKSMTKSTQPLKGKTLLMLIIAFSAGFEGEQANGLELEESLLGEPIDVFILYLKDSKKRALEFPAL